MRLSGKLRGALTSLAREDAERFQAEMQAAQAETPPRSPHAVAFAFADTIRRHRMSYPEWQEFRQHPEEAKQAYVMVLTAPFVRT